MKAFTISINRLYFRLSLSLSHTLTMKKYKYKYIYNRKTETTISIWPPDAVYVEKLDPEWLISWTDEQGVAMYGFSIFKCPEYS